MDAAKVTLRSLRVRVLTALRVSANAVYEVLVTFTEIERHWRRAPRRRGDRRS
ncbi:MAG TPA: hypothetical protein VNN07_13855 [Candidatus Tectomicrobia bacterium]|nr:hypothetical protein [Candidatus Tectomicrobia bacterium]